MATLIFLNYLQYLHMDKSGSQLEARPKKMAFQIVLRLKLGRCHHRQVWKMLRKLYYSICVCFGNIKQKNTQQFKSWICTERMASKTFPSYLCQMQAKACWVHGDLCQ